MLVAGAAAAAGVAGTAGVAGLTGLTGLTGNDEESVPAGPVVRGAFRSQARSTTTARERAAKGVTTRWSLIRPPGISGPLPVVVALHGHGGSTAALLDERWDLPGALARAVVVDGVAPFALATVSGGRSFWHERPWGEDAGAMVSEELLPMLLARPDVVATRIGLLGWSMGGYGSLRLGAILGPDRVAAICASSPGLYLDPSLAHPDGFHDAAEYERFSVMDHQRDLAGIPLRVDIGTEDPFYAATRAYVDGFPDDQQVSASFTAGGHDLAFSQRVLPAELAFLAAHVG